jgi:site-specific DNA-cytosine methylase
VRDDLEIEPSHPGGESRGITVREAIKGVCDYLMPFVPSRESKSGFLLTNLKQGQRATELIGTRYGTVRLNLKETFPTISKRAYAEAGYSHLIHPVKERSMSISELRRGTSFPDCYKFIDYCSAHRIIGNSVPPLFMEAIARHVRNEILDRVTTPLPAGQGGSIPTGAL